MLFPDTLWAKLYDFARHQQTGQCILHFHQGVLTKYEFIQVVTVPRWRDDTVSRGLPVVEEIG